MPLLVKLGTVFALGLAVAGVVLFALSGTAQGGPPPKPATLSGHTVVVAESPMSTQIFLGARAECPDGKGVISGGYSLSNSGIDDFVVQANHPASEFTVTPEGGRPTVIHDGWEVQIKRLSPPSSPWGVLAWAVCIDTE